MPLTGQLTRVIRTSMVEELDKDYVRTAMGFGIPKGVVIARNVLRNALITPVTVLGMRIGYLIGGAVVIEVDYTVRSTNNRYNHVYPFYVTEGSEGGAAE